MQRTDAERMREIVKAGSPRRTGNLQDNEITDLNQVNVNAFTFNVGATATYPYLLNEFQVLRTRPLKATGVGRLYVNRHYQYVNNGIRIAVGDFAFRYNGKVEYM